MNKIGKMITDSNNIDIHKKIMADNFAELKAEIEDLPVVIEHKLSVFVFQDSDDLCNIKIKQRGDSGFVLLDLVLSKDKIFLNCERSETPKIDMQELFFPVIELLIKDD